MPDMALARILAIDAGTSALKAALYDSAGQVIASASRGYENAIPQPGWVECDPGQWWMALEEALAMLRQSGQRLDQIEAIGVTGQMHTAILLDRQGIPLAPTILWLDRRAADETAELREQLNLPPYQLNSTSTLPKLLWLSRHRPDVLAEVKGLVWPKDYLRMRLTDVRATDITDAAGAGLIDWERRVWATDRLALCGLDPAILPPIRPADDAAGPLIPRVADALGLPRRARVIIGAGDVIALIGGAPPTSRRFSVSLGSSAMIAYRLPKDVPVNDQRERMYNYPFLPVNILNGVLSTSGAALAWAGRSLYDPGTPLEEVVRAALETPPGAGGVCFLPFLAGERSPYWSDALRGGFYGLTLAHDRTHLTRAVMEGVACSLRHLTEICESLGWPVDQLALSGGGGATQGWAQIIADVCQRPLAIYAGRDTVTRGLYAYCRAALDPATTFDAALAQTFEQPQPVSPRAEHAAVYDRLYQTYRTLADYAAETLIAV